jgi:hypothetical protein
MVQVGGVFMPQVRRGRSCFTPRPDAVAAYRAVGFEQIGCYAVVLFAAWP